MKQRLLSMFVCLWLIWLVNPAPINVCVPGNDGKTDTLICVPFVEVGISDDAIADATKQHNLWLPKAFVDKLSLDKNPNPQI